MTATTAPTWNDRTPGSRRPITSWLITPATAMVRPLLVDRNAANAPAVVSADRSVPPVPSTIRDGSSSTIVSVAPARDEVRRVEAAERAVHRRQDVEEAEQAEHHERRTPCGAAVGVGVEAHDDVRQAHRAEERRDDDRVRRVEAVVARCA